MEVPAAIFGISHPRAYNHHPTHSGRNLVAGFRGSPSSRSASPLTIRNLILEPFNGKQNAYKHYYNMAKTKSAQKNISNNIKKIGGERMQIPNRPHLQNPQRPRYQGQMARKTSINKVLHKYPELLPLFYLPNSNFSPILTAYLQNRSLPGYEFFPPYPNRTRGRRMRSPSPSGSSSESNGRSKNKSPKKVQKKQKKEANKGPIFMGSPKLEKTPSSNSTGNTVPLQVGNQIRTSPAR